MMKSEKLGSKFEQVLDLLNEAECVLQGIKEIPNAYGEKLNFRFVELTGLVEEITYEICMPLEMEEEEKLAKIEKMEKELFELRASLR